jgi:hypothetical protein
MSLTWRCAPILRQAQGWLSPDKSGEVVQREHLRQ